MIKKDVFVFQMHQCVCMGYKLVYIYIYILIDKAKKNPIRYQIRIQMESNFAPCVPSNLSF